MSRPKNTAVNDIDITDILGDKYRYCHDDIDPPLMSLISGAIHYIDPLTSMGLWPVTARAGKKPRFLEFF